MASTTRVEDAAADAVAADRAAAAPKKEKEKRASAGFATPPLISRPSARCGLRQWRSPRRKQAVAPPPTNKREVPAAAQAVAEQTTVAAPPAAVDPLCLLSPPPPLPRAEMPTCRCLKMKKGGWSQKTRRAGFGPAWTRGQSLQRRHLTSLRLVPAQSEVSRHN
jgi:hypothetical protein